MGGTQSSGGRSATGGRSAGGSDASGGDLGIAGAGGAGVVGIACPDLDENTVPDCDETPVDNATFNTDVVGWRIENYASATWSFVNAQAGEKSGSILIESNAPMNATSGDAFVYTGVTQCLVLDGPPRAHQIFAQMYSDGNVVAGYGSVVGRQFTSEDCSGTPSSVTASLNQGNTSNWFTMQTPTFMADPGAKSLMVELRIGKLATRAGPVSLRFDNVMVR